LVFWLFVAFSMVHWIKRRYLHYVNILLLGRKAPEPRAANTKDNRMIFSWLNEDWMFLILVFMIITV